MKFKNILFAALGAFGLLSCYEDKGNYDYDPLNQAGTALNREYLCVRGEALSIIPYVTHTQLQDDPGAYSYLWLTKSQNKERKIDTIGRERKLNSFINLAQGDYLLEFVIHDIKHDVDWRSAATLKVTLTAPEGWLFMEDNNGKADISMWARMGDGSMRLLSQLLSESGVPEEALYGPRQVFNVDNFNKIGKGVWFMTDKMTGYLDVSKGLLWTDAQLMKNHMLEPVGNDYAIDFMVRGGSPDLIVFRQGAMHYSFNGNLLFSADLCYMDGQAFKVAPFIGDGGAMALNYLLYDVTNKRFVNFEKKNMMGGGTMVFKKTMGFPTGYDFIRMDCFTIGMQKTIYAVLKNADGVYEAVMQQPEIAPSSIKLLGKTQNIMNAEHYAYHQTNRLLYYALGEKLFVSREGREFPVTVQKKDPKTGALSDYRIEGRITCMVTKDLSGYNQYPHIKEFRECVVVATQMADGTGRVYLLHADDRSGMAHQMIFKGVAETAHKVVSISYQIKL